jgi:hypothetical protein
MSEAKPETAAPSYNNDESAAAAVLAHMEKEEPSVETPEAPAAEAEEAQPVEEAQPEAEGQINIDPEAKVFDVEEVVEGGNKETRKYSLNELKAQRMMQADYQRKTAELARQREKTQEEARQAVDQERKNFLANAQAVQQALITTAATEFQQEGVNLLDQVQLRAYMGRLSSEDPAKYVRMQNRLNEINASLGTVQQTIAFHTQKALQERKSLAQKQSQDAWEVLVRDVPNWNQEKYSELLKVGYEYGFKPEEIANPVRQDGSIPDGYIPALDHRFIKLLNDAQAYRQQQKQQPIVEKKVSAAPKVIKPGAPAKVDNKQRQEDKMARLKKTGRIDEAASMLESMMR